jgi:hypothetical protein
MQAQKAKFLYITMIMTPNYLTIHKAYVRLILPPSLQASQISSFERFAREFQCLSGYSICLHSV